MSASNYHKHTPPTRRFMTLVYYTGGKSDDPRVPDSPLAMHKRERPGDVVSSYDDKTEYRVGKNGELRRLEVNTRRAA